jgi:hypothetical protein
MIKNINRSQLHQEKNLKRRKYTAIQSGVIRREKKRKKKKSGPRNLLHQESTQRKEEEISRPV